MNDDEARKEAARKLVYSLVGDGEVPDNVMIVSDWNEFDVTTEHTTLTDEEAERLFESFRAHASGLYSLTGNEQPSTQWALQILDDLAEALDAYEEERAAHKLTKEREKNLEKRLEDMTK